MISRFLTTALILGGLGLLATYFFDRDRVLALLPDFVGSSSPGGSSPSGSAPAMSRGSIVMASWNLRSNLRADEKNLDLAESLAPIVGRFDVLAIQGVDSRNDAFLKDIVMSLATEGRNYRVAKSGGLGPLDRREQLAFFYDADTLEMDPTTYVVGDPDGLFQYPPFVAAFRVVGPGEDRRFTFTLVNVRLDTQDAGVEINFLDDVFRAVRDDGREEDDVILLGTLHNGPNRFGDLRRIPHLTWAIEGKATTVGGIEPMDNIVFDGRATAEYHGDSGVLGLPEDMSQFLHRPIWASFGIEEALPGGR